MTYEIGVISSNNIVSSRRVTGTIDDAKKAAIDAFGDGFLDDEIDIWAVESDGSYILVARRMVGGSRWQAAR